MLPKGRRLSKPTPAASELNCGLYVLIMKMDACVSARVGKLGRITFSPGYHAYCGSARRNLSHRLSRHMTRRKTLRWHIDYLTCRNDVSVVSTRIFSHGEMTECRLNSLVQELPNAVPIARFGCSDCHCTSHLTFLGDTLPDLHLEPNAPHEQP